MSHIQPLLFGLEVVLQNGKQQDTHQVGGESAVAQAETAMEIGYGGDHVIMENGSKETVAPAVLVGNGGQTVGKTQPPIIAWAWRGWLKVPPARWDRI